MACAKFSLFKILIGVLVSSAFVACGSGAEIIERTVVVERVVEKKVVETVVVEKQIPGAKVVETVVVEREKPVVQTVVVEKIKEQPQKADPRPGRVIWSSGLDLSSPDPHVWSVDGDGQLFDKIYESLPDSPGWDEMVPGLATNWTVRSDFLTWAFKLRKDVKFHNGDRVTAEDVKWSLLRLRDHPQGNLKLQVAMIKEINIVDGDTIEIVTKEPAPTFPQFIAAGRVLSKQQASRDGERFFEKFIGTGPWQFDQWIPGTKFSFKRNEGWWGKFDPGAPTYLEHRPIPETATMVAALLVGEIDVADRLTSEPLALIDRSGIAKGIKRPGKEANEICMGSDRPPFDKKEMRQAMDLMVPRVEIVTKLTQQGVAAITRAPESSRWFPEDLKGKVKPFDIPAAQELMKKAGYKGEPIRLMTRSGRAPKDKEIAELLGEIWRGAGLNAKVEIVGDAAFSSRRAAGDYEMFMTGWPVNNPPHNFNQHMTGHKIGYHETHPDFWALTKAMAVETDPDKFLKMVKDIQRYMYNDPPCLPIWHFELFWGVSNRIEKFVNVGGVVPALYEESVLTPAARGR